jgi:hypothetical protein
MRTAVTSVAAIFAVGLPLLAGALVVEIGNPAENAEALSKHAVLVARTAACHSPEKTVLTATAEGVIDGQRRSIPLNLISLSSAPGAFAVTHEWPSTGTWVIKIVATNPEFKSYATGAVVPFEGNAVIRPWVKHFFHEPTGEEVAAMLDIQFARSATATRAAVN